MEGFRITGTPGAGDIKKVSAAMDDVLPEKEVKTPAPVEEPEVKE